MRYLTKIKETLRRLLNNPTARVPILLIGGASLNLIYIATNVASAIIYRNLWAATLTVYHLVLIIIRAYLLFVGRPTAERAGRHICLRVGGLLMLLDLICAAIMLYSIRRHSFTSYSGLILLCFLAFTVYSLARSAFEIKKYRGGANHLYFTAKNLSLATSLMSVFNLQYSIFALIGLDSTLTGRGILLCGMSVFSIILFLSFSLMRRGIGSSGGGKF